MKTMTNENILKLIFRSISISKTKQLIDIIFNKTLSSILVSLLDYKKIINSFGKSKLKFHKQEDNICSCTILNSDTFIIASTDKTIKVFDLKTFKCIRTIKGKDVSNIISLSDNIIVTSEPACLKFLDVNNDFKCIKIIKHSYYATNLLLLTDGSIACSTYSRSSYSFTGVDIYSSKKDYAFLKTLKGHSGIVRASTKLSKNKFATACKKIKIWDIEKDYGCIKTIDQNMPLKCLAYCDKYNLLVTSVYDKSMRLWNNKYVCVKVIVTGIDFVSLAILTGGYLASGTYLGHIEIWDLKNFQNVDKIQVDADEVSNFFVLNDHRIISQLWSRNENALTLWG
jgi:WD40 repeat protein